MSHSTQDSLATGLAIKAQFEPRRYQQELEPRLSGSGGRAMGCEPMWQRERVPLRSLNWPTRQNASVFRFGNPGRPRIGRSDTTISKNPLRTVDVCLLSCLPYIHEPASSPPFATTSGTPLRRVMRVCPEPRAGFAAARDTRPESPRDSGFLFKIRRFSRTTRR